MPPGLATLLDDLSCHSAFARTPSSGEDQALNSSVQPCCSNACFLPRQDRTTYGQTARLSDVVQAFLGYDRRGASARPPIARLEPAGSQMSPDRFRVQLLVDGVENKLGQDIGRVIRLAINQYADPLAVPPLKEGLANRL